MMAGSRLADTAKRMAVRRENYESGWTDYQLADEDAVPTNTIVVWRKKYALPPNSPRNIGRMKPDQVAARMLLYQLGWSDVHIARQMGRHRSSVWDWRETRKLPPNFASGANECRDKRPTIKDLTARVRRAVGRALPRDIADDVTSDLLMAVLDGTIPVADIEKLSRKYGNKVLDRYASKFGPRSIDEALPGTEDLRMIDLLVDERSSGWLEEMGATVW